jgi:hypothetical protein
MSCGCREAMCEHTLVADVSTEELFQKTRKRKLDGMAMKFTVLKNDDIEKLGHHAKVALGHVAEEIKELREKEDKKNNLYLVINTDEPYADQVIDILKANGHWG